MEQPNGMINVLLVDDHAVVREGYRRLLERTNDIRVMEEAETGEQAYKILSTLLPDVVIMDINLPGIGGIEVVRRIVSRFPEQKILMFSMHEDVVFLSRALQAGAKGYVTKSSAPEVMVKAVRLVHSGKFFISDQMAQELAVKSMPGKSELIDTLSGKEFEVFRLLVSGNSLHDISAVMNLSYKTIANYQSNIRHKLDVENMAQVFQIALNHGVISNTSIQEKKGDIPD